MEYYKIVSKIQIYQLINNMKSISIQSIFISSKVQIGECYIVIGSYAGKVKSLSAKSDYLQVIEGANLSLIGLQGGLQLWQYQPQKLIKQWKISSKPQDYDQIGCIFKDQNWQILLQIRTVPFKIKNVKQIARYDSLKELSTQSSSKSKGKMHKKMTQIKQHLKQKIKLLTVKPESNPKSKEHYNAYYSSYSSKYPSFFASFANSQNEIHQSCLDYCAQKQKEQFDSKQAQNIYGLYKPKQAKQKHSSKHKFHMKAPHYFS